MIGLLADEMKNAVNKLSKGERLMLIDIYNGVILTPGLMGQSLRLQVDDSFDLDPGEYEKKWDVDKAEMLKKVERLNTYESILLEFWATGFWKISTDKAGELEEYVAGKISIATYYNYAIKRLLVAESPRKIQEVVGFLERLF